MFYERENEYTTSYYRCIDPIENFRIKVLLKPVKNAILPLPQFDVDTPEDPLPYMNHENTQQDFEEYIFQWQEKVFSKTEFRKYKESHERKKLNEKYHGKILLNTINKKNPQRLFSYVDVDNHSHKEESVNVKKKCRRTIFENSQKIKNFDKIPKAKIVNYYPINDYKNECNALNNKFVQKMFIMIDLGCNNSENDDSEENHCIICSLGYNAHTKLFEMTPSFSKSQQTPYVIGISNLDSRNFFYYWLIHASPDISTNSLRKEIGIMAKVLNHQKELKKLLIGNEFNVGLSNCLNVTLLGEIVSGANFEYDYLYVRYYIKLPDGWDTEETEALTGVTHTCRENSNGTVHFSHLFEITLSVNIQLFEDHSSLNPEIIFEVLSVDKYNRYRNEGYTYINVPERSGMFEYNLKCWRASDRKIRSELERFFIGGGPELEDIAYVGLSNNQRMELISRFGFESRPSGRLYVKLNILHKADSFKKDDPIDDENLGYQKLGKLDANSLLSSVNTVLEAFRMAKAKMLEAREGIGSSEANGRVIDGSRIKSS